MSDKTKTDVVLECIEKYLTRLNVYFALAIFALFLIVLGSIIPAPMGKFGFALLENKYWPVALVLFELFRREVEKKTSKNDKSKLAKLEAVLVSGKKLEHGFLLAIIKGRDDELGSSMTAEYMDARMRRDNPIK